MRIFLIRHGETVWNAARIVQLPETRLSPRGELQAASVARRLAVELVAAVLASDYTRAMQTAEAVSVATGARLSTSSLLRERHLGVHRGTAIDALTVDLFAADYHPPEGESVAEFRARVAEAWHQMLAAAAELAGDLVVVSHALLVREVIEQFLDTRSLLEPGEPLRLPNTAVTVFARDAPHAVQTLGCAAHLEGDALPDTRVHPAGI